MLLSLQKHSCTSGKLAWQQRHQLAWAIFFGGGQHHMHDVARNMCMTSGCQEKLGAELNVVATWLQRPAAPPPGTTTGRWLLRSSFPFMAAGAGGTGHWNRTALGSMLHLHAFCTWGGAGPHPQNIGRTKRAQPPGASTPARQHSKVCSNG